MTDETKKFGSKFMGYECSASELTEQYKTEFLPLAYHDYDTFTEEEKSTIQNMSNFFCGLHALVNYAETAQMCIRCRESDF
jgi:hypothetical protein